MAYDDIQVHSSTGGEPRIAYYRMDDAELFSKGDVVVLADTGQIQEALTTGPIPAGLTGIAMAGAIGAGGIVINNPRTDAAYAENDRLPVVLPSMDVWFITKNFSAASTAFDDTAPLQADIGNECGLVSIGGVWGLDLAPDSNDATCRLHDILNSRKQSILDTNETLATTDVFHVVFQIIAHQGNVVASEAPPPIAET